MNIIESKITSFNNYFLTSNPNTGALSVLSSEELIIFKMLQFSNDEINLESITTYYYRIGYDRVKLLKKSKHFLQKLTNDGWLNTQLLEIKETPMQFVYLNLTESCNFNCPYCYQGNTHHKINMSKNDFYKVIQKIIFINPKCHIALTGGEPLLHPDFIAFINYLENFGLDYSILTNGSLLNEDTVQFLSKCKYLKKIQVSLDGFNLETHEITRGNTFQKVMKGIKLLISNNLPYSIAPTVHDKNVCDIYDIAKFALENRGNIEPNNLREMPNNRMASLTLSEKNLEKSISLIKKAKSEVYKKNNIPNELDCKDHKVIAENGNKLICGMGYSLFNIDIKGDIYPCHLLSYAELKLGNIISDCFNSIEKKAIELNIRTKSTEIAKCKTCHFVCSCHGGCRADSYNKHKSFIHPDSLCAILYKYELENFIRLRTKND